jgi:UDP-N-acetylmuramate dehydrogenase
VDELKSILNEQIFKDNPKLILGGGSNILFTKNFDGFVIKNNIKGIEKIGEDERSVFVRVGAGENWHEFVMWCIAHDLAGLENLSLIPGNVGASPMQNIGAYGVEIKDVFEELTAVEVASGEEVRFKNKDCEFGYRESIFKRKYREKFCITSVVYRLNKNAVLNTSYGAIEQQLETAGIKNPTIRSVSDAVIAIRSSKLPSPNKIGNAGSFFKNPEVNGELYEAIKQKFPNVVAYPLENKNYKLAAGWLIEQAGWKGKRFGDAGVHTQQALVLVNYANASGDEIYSLSQQIMDAVYEKFNVLLEREVNIY